MGHDKFIQDTIMSSISSSRIGPIWLIDNKNTPADSKGNPRQGKPRHASCEEALPLRLLLGGRDWKHQSNYLVNISK